MSIVVTIVVVVLVLAGVAAYLVRRNPGARAPWGHNESKRLQRAYGPEYDRLYAANGDEAAVEQELGRREQARRDLEITEPSQEDRDRLGAGWAGAQASFVDDPGGAARRAEQLIGEALAVRGYPAGDAEERLALASVDHAHAVSEFRDGHELLQRSQTGVPGVDATEQLRQAMLHFRVFFEELTSASTKASSSVDQKEKVHA
jgi:hypothetical protein